MNKINWDNVEFKNEKRFLSNMYPVPIVIDGVTYNSSENFYMAMKFLGTEYEHLIPTIASATPREAKLIAKANHSHIRDDWQSISIRVMTIALMAKFTQHLELASKLLDTGSEYLEERNDWNDTFWGTYLGKGYNNLGILLMQVRSLIQGD